ncbi:hypothetical protein [uncultured Aliiroseovarius sp.]|uniref:hypothetical protein n=1 Tax=uncultured Aliiroseovarius sp. TaxID=1658783 RepID=UPI00260E1D6C|nr:hypothetical protein [uncultured Aliiroseovarius sp.]
MSLLEVHAINEAKAKPPANASRPATSRVTKWLAALGFALLFAAIYGRLMGYGLRRDEMLFVPPAVLLPDLQLYGDYFYNHVPYSAWYFKAMALIFGSGGLLFSTRLGIFFAWVGLAAAMGWTMLRLSGSIRMAAFGVISVLTSHALMDGPGMAATNNLLQLPFALFGMGLFLVEVKGATLRPATLVLSGVMLSVATGMKVSSVAFIPPIAIAAFLLPAALPFSARLTRVVLPVLAGGLIGALPLFWLLLSDPDLFLAHIMKFHVGPHVTYWEANKLSEPDLAMGLGQKLQLAYGVWLQGAALIVALVILALAWMGRTAAVARTKGRWSDRSALGLILVVLATLVTTAGMSLTPTPGFSQYYIAPLVCLPVLAALIYDALPPATRAQSWPLLSAATAMLVLIAVPWLAPDMRKTLRPGMTTPAKIERGAAALQDSIAQLRPAGSKVATFLPIYPLEAGLSVYPEFATGQFAYRIAPYTDPDLARFYVMAGPDDIGALFDRDPPQAILIGYEPALEAPLRDYALTHGYRKVSVPHLDNRYGQGEVYFNIGGQEK